MSLQSVLENKYFIIYGVKFVTLILLIGLVMWHFFKIFNTFFNYNAYNLVKIYYVDVPNTKLRYIVAYPYNYVYTFDNSTNILLQPYLKGNMVCKNSEVYSTVIQFDYRLLGKQTPENSTWNLSCRPNMYEQVYKYIMRSNKRNLHVLTLQYNKDKQMYSSIDIINELIAMGVITLEKK